MVDVDDPTAQPAATFAPVATVPLLRLVFSGDRTFFHDHRLEDAETEVGRGSALRIDNDPRLSRRHAAFVVDRGRVRLENRSSNGSFVNGIRVDETAELGDGDVVRLGDTFLVLRFMPDAGRDIPSATLLGRAPAMMQLRTLLSVVGPTRASVILLGETGAGKDVAAHAIHDASGRAGPFIPVNCAAIPESLAESQLFGHRAGSFTGAVRDHTGFFREAHRGTLFLDEVGELPLSLQPKLLRVLDEKNVYAVGASSGVAVDVRIVAATNRKLASDVEAGRFRGDLFARLAEIMIALPPLRARKEDVLLLLERALPRLSTGEQLLSPALVSLLLLHGWPFNVRELLKIAMELDVRSQGRKILDVDLLEGRILSRTPASTSSPSEQIEPSEPSEPVEKSQKIPPIEEKHPAPSREALLELVARCGGRVTDVAKATGRSRTQVYRWLQQYGIDVEQFRS